jgi:hypothetical protein
MPSVIEALVMAILEQQIRTLGSHSTQSTASGALLNESGRLSALDPTN